jgi:CubicO group peptidase (beta-lactamase class C family)
MSGVRLQMKLPRSLKFALLSLALLLTTGLGYGVYMLTNLAPIGAAYAAKTLCSGVFVSGRAALDVIREDIRAENHPLLRFVLPEVDPSRHIASATFLGLARREADYRSGLGCTIAFGTINDPSAAATMASSSEPDGFEDGSPAGHVDTAKLQTAIDDAFTEPDSRHLRRTRALVVVQDGRIVAERYAPGFSPTTPLPGWSMTKTVAGVLIGTLVKAGKLAPEQKGLVAEWRNAGDPRAEITLDQLLRMTSGLRFSEDYGDPLEDVGVMLFARADGAAFAIDKPLEVTPGTRWRYSSGTSNILSRVIRLAVGGGEQDYLGYPRHALFNRIGMHSAVIEPDSSGTLVTSSFMYASARDWARLGQFLLQNGSWNGERIVPDGWVKYMATLTPQSKRGDFGAHLWVKVPPPFNGNAAERSRIPSDAFHAVGYEGQFVSVVPSRRLVVVRLGLSRFERAWNHDAFLARLLEAFPE